MMENGGFHFPVEHPVSSCASLKAGSFILENLLTMHASPIFPTLLMANGRMLNLSLIWLENGGGSVRNLEVFTD